MLSEDFNPKKLINLIDPRIVQKLNDQNINIVDLLPQLSDSEQNYLEFIATEEYNDVCDKLDRYFKDVPMSEASLPRLINKLMSELQRVISVESSHKEFLEKLVIQTVFELKEFKPLKEAYENGQIELDVKLEKPNINLNMSDNVQENGLTAYENANKDLGEFLVDEGLKLKRFFANAMTQGTAVSSNYLYELVRNDLIKIDSKLPDSYGLIMSATKLGYWIMDSDSIKGKNPLGGGEEKVTNENGKFTIMARGVIFPILIHEFVKGAMEVLSYKGLPSDSDSAQALLTSTDFADNEFDDLRIGNQLYKKIISNFDTKDRELFAYVYAKILEMPVSGDFDPGKEFISTIQTLLTGGNNGKDIVKNILKDVREELRNYE